MSESTDAPITVYGKETCKWCQKAKIILDEKGVAFEYIDVLQPCTHCDKSGAECMKDRMGIPRDQKATLPQIFFGDQLIGGHDDLVAHYAASESTPKV